jgi:hypothetical protein
MLQDAITVLILLGLGVLQCAGLFWPALGDLWTLINSGIIIGILFMGWIICVTRWMKRKHSDR